ncbi:gastrin/cholecystokinin type B receptor-like [Patiria miniata]|uniref:G-protein coupled receptors family 1 profile domain-containing protein n=1 Tax=Patiria miniata TaxID=46514 RepID=A0A913ZSW2_PATMI|nr:gastrin/cholecystokinin type B receptor-like [Patiria miniata]
MDNASSFASPTAPSMDPTDDGPLTAGPDVGMTINAILKLIFYVTVMILGISGNSLILKVYWSKPQKTSTHVLIMGLAWIDLMVCVCRIYSLSFFIYVLLGRELPSVFTAIRIFDVVNVFASIVVTGAIALERYDCVCRSGKRLLNHRWAKLMYLGSYLAATAVCIPITIDLLSPSVTAKKVSRTFQLLLYLTVVFTAVICYGKVYQAIRKHVKVNVLSRHGPGTSWSTAVTVKAESRRHDASVVTGVSISQALPSSSKEPLTADRSGPRSVFVVSATELAGPSTNPPDARGHLADALPSTGNLAPASQNHEGDREPRSPNPQARDNPTSATMKLQQKTTRMLFVTSVVFLVTWLPYWLFVAVSLHKLNGGDVHPNVLSVMYNCTLFVYINNVVNPFIYGLANRRFRKDCLDVLRKMKPC